MWVCIDSDCLDDPRLDNSLRISRVDKMARRLLLLVIPQLSIGTSRSFRRPLDKITPTFNVGAHQIAQFLRYLYSRKDTKNLQVANYFFGQAKLESLHIFTLAADG
ncbi:hypothetical protein CFB41_06755 [Burkholderia sp. AU33803]|nr:hypothetical protein CFB41_06755 [Burkholderia sp. AU33803]PRD86551.1 hypothetical protein C6P88_30645 [Burkholderia contaminans]